MAGNQGTHFERLLQRLQNAQSRMLGSASSADFSEKRGGVYVFSTPDDGTVVYVGKGKNLQSRLRWHANDRGGGSQDFAVKLPLARQEQQFAWLPPDPRTYLVRYVVIDEPILCDRFETFAIERLRPLLNKAKVLHPLQVTEAAAPAAQEAGTVGVKVTFQCADRVSAFELEMERRLGVPEEVWFENTVYRAFELLVFGTQRPARKYLATRTTPPFRIEAWDSITGQWVTGEAIALADGDATDDAHEEGLVIAVAAEGEVRQVQISLSEIKDAWREASRKAPRARDSGGGVDRETRRIESSRERAMRRQEFAVKNPWGGMTQ